MKLFRYAMIALLYLASADIHALDFNTFCKRAWTVTKWLLIHDLHGYSSILAHESGHWLAGKTLLGLNGTIKLDLRGGGSTKFDTAPEFSHETGLQWAAIGVAGPYANIVYNSALLFAYTVYAEKHIHHKTWSDALYESMQKPLFNNNQPPALRLIIAMNALSNVLQLAPIPIGQKIILDGVEYEVHIDGYNAWKALSFYPPAERAYHGTLYLLPALCIAGYCTKEIIQAIKDIYHDILNEEDSSDLALQSV